MRTTRRTASKTTKQDQRIIVKGAAFRLDQVQFVATSAKPEITGLGSGEEPQGVIVLDVQNGPVCIRIDPRTAQAIIDAIEKQQKD